MAEWNRLPARTLVPVAILCSGALIGAARAQDAASRLASWGAVSAYAEAAAVDTPLRALRDAFWDGKSGEAPLSDQSQPQGLKYAPVHKHAAVLEELPGSASVVVGTVRSARSYLSGDRTTIYTEMVVAVSQVLRDRSTAALAAGSSISVARAGGAIRIGSHKLLIRGCHEESMPRFGHQYLLALGYSRAAAMFPIVGAYELDGDHVYMLDSVEPIESARHGSKPGTREQFFLTEYGLPTADFLEIVGKTLGRSK